MFEQYLPQYTIRALAGVGKCFVFFQLVDSDDEKNCDEEENKKNNNNNNNNSNDTNMPQNKANSDVQNPHFILNQLYAIATNLQFRFCEVVTPLQCCLPLNQTQEISICFQERLGPLSPSASPSTYGIDFKCHDRDPPGICFEKRKKGVLKWSFCLHFGLCLGQRIEKKERDSTLLLV